MRRQATAAATSEVGMSQMVFSSTQLLDEEHDDLDLSLRKPSDDGLDILERSQRETISQGKSAKWSAKSKGLQNSYDALREEGTHKNQKKKFVDSDLRTSRKEKFQFQVENMVALNASCPVVFLAFMTIIFILCLGQLMSGASEAQIGESFNMEWLEPMIVLTPS